MALKITSIEQLMRESRQGTDFFILLNHSLRSGKWILWDENEGVFNVINLIDGTEQLLTPSQMMDRNHTNIGFAITRGALFKG